MPWCFREDAGREAQKGRAFVINLDDKGNGGTHWVAARKIGNTVYYADPFGTVLEGYSPEELLVGKPKVVANSIAWQRPSTAYCGYFAYLFANAMNQLKPGASRKDLEHALWMAIK